MGVENAYQLCRRDCRGEGRRLGEEEEEEAKEEEARQSPTKDFRGWW